MNPHPTPGILWAFKDSTARRVQSLAVDGWRASQAANSGYLTAPAVSVPASPKTPAAAASQAGMAAAGPTLPGTRTEAEALSPESAGAPACPAGPTPVCAGLQP